MNAKFKFYRREMGLSQYELGAAAGVPRYKIQLIEQGIGCLSENEGKRIFRILGLKFDSSVTWMADLIFDGGQYEQ